MPLHHSIRATLAATLLGCVCASAHAVKVGPDGQISLDAFVPASIRPYAASEIYGKATHTQKVEQIRIIQAEIAYRGVGFTAQQVCAAYKPALERGMGSGAVLSHRFGCQPYPSPNGDDRVRTVVVANYKNPSKLITQTASAIFTVCKPRQLYDGARHICYDPKPDGGGN